jgi:peptide/nickel transport system substrate-binding protein
LPEQEVLHTCVFTRRATLIYLVTLVLLSACQVFRQPTPAAPSHTSSPESGILQSTATVLPETTGEPTPSQPLQVLTVCLDEEPKSLFWYAADSSAAALVLAALMDGPFDRLNFNNLAVILEKEPAFQDGDASMAPVTVLPGAWLYDISGARVALAEGVRYRPAGCSGLDCVVSYNGAEAVTIDQLVLQFRLKSGLKWSDGAPLGADDSLFSYEVARALQPPAWRAVLQATSGYQLLDDLTLEWRGLPGYRDGTYAEKFFVPLPRHTWGALEPQALPEAEASARTPLGWGAYQIESWQAGEQIVLRQNPNYFRAADGLPVFDRLVYRFIESDQPLLQELRSGACDWVAPAAISREQASELQAAEEAQVILQPAAAWEQITLGIERRDGGASLLAQPQVRQALALCIDRQAVAQSAWGDLAEAAQGFLPPGHPEALISGASLSFDPQAGAQLLSDAGWVDLDGNPATPRTAFGVPGLQDGTPLNLEILVSPDADRQAAVRQVQADLAGCGVGLTNVTQPFEAYLAPGPEGPVFGRSFQLAQFAWPAAGEKLCSLYLSSEIPGPYPEAPKDGAAATQAGLTSRRMTRPAREF